MLSSFSTKRLKLPHAGTACRMLVLTAFVSIAAASCTTSIDENSAYSLSVEEAMDFFDEAVINSDTKSSSGDGTGVFYLGNIIPNWSGHELNRNCLTGVENVETTISTEYKYRVLQSDGKRTRYTSCYQKLVIAQDSEGKQHGAFVIFFIPTNDYDWGHKKNLEKKFDNDGDMKDYSGLKLYCTLDGRLSRVNQYEDGQKIGGVYFPGIKTETELKTALEWLEGWFGNMTFQRGTRVTKSTPNMDVEDDGFDYSSIGEVLNAAVITGSYNSDTDDSNSSTNGSNSVTDDLRLETDKLINDSQINGGNDDDDLMDDQAGGNDGAGKKNESGKPVEWEVGGQKIVINCENMSQEQWDNLQGTLSKLGQLDAMKKIVKELKKNGYDYKVYAVSKKTFLNVYDNPSAAAANIPQIVKNKITGEFIRYNLYSTIYINIESLNFLGILEEFYHSLTYCKDPTQQLLRGDIEVEAKMFLGSLVDTQIPLSEFISMVGDTQPYMDLWNYARGVGDIQKAIDAMANLGYYYDSFPTSYLKEAPGTADGLEKANEWARSRYEFINGIFFHNNK